MNRYIFFLLSFVLVLGNNAVAQDTDGDGLSDSDEINIYLTNPNDDDTDDDGLTDGFEVNGADAASEGEDVEAMIHWSLMSMEMALQMVKKRTITILRIYWMAHLITMRY